MRRLGHCEQAHSHPSSRLTFPSFLLSVNKPKAQERGHKRRPEGESEGEGAQAPAPASAPKKGANMIGVQRYRPLLNVGFTASGALVAAERPWPAILEAFPEPLYRSRYGT